VVITHLASERFFRAKDLLSSTTGYFQERQPLLEIIQSLVIYQPKKLQYRRKSYLQFLSFKFRSNKEWFKFTSTKAFLRVIFSEIHALMVAKSQLQISSKKLFATSVLSRKHVRAWERGIDESMDGIIILEDDAILNPANQEQLRGVLTFLKSHEPIFINFSTGITTKGYIFDNYVNSENSILWKQARFADTTCAYFMNKIALRLVLDAYYERKFLDSLGIDFILSDIFIKNRKIKVLHLNDPVFKNGSLIGAFTSQLDSIQNP